MKRLLLLSLLCVLAACKPESSGLNGYVEGEYLYIAPSTSGLLQTLDVEKGQWITEGKTLFKLDLTNLKASLATAEAELERAKALLEAAERDFRRTAQLAPSGGASLVDLEAKKATYLADSAVVRQDEQKIVQIKKQIEEAQPRAHQTGRVEDTFYRPGEFVAAGTPVISLLPPENIKIRFFVSQRDAPRYGQGTPLTLRCDGCAEPIPAKVTFVASEVEYTPPVIYSIESRQKLVIMIEAKPNAFSPALRPGLPLDIELAKP